jgi:glycogen debranching enzyme
VPLRTSTIAPFLLTIAAAILLASAPRALGQQSSASLELSRPIRPWEFLPLTGTRAALFGNESGQMEAWVYPLKLLRNFHLQFLTEGHAIPAESLARTIRVRPESATITYASDTFTVRETLFVPVSESGAIIFFDVETEKPLEIEAHFVRDFQLEWPAAIGGTYMSWDQNLHAFAMGEETRKFAAIVGSPTATETQEEYQTNYSSSPENGFRLGVTQKGRESKLIVIAGSMTGRADAESVYRRLSSSPAQLLHDSADYYKKYLNDTVSITLPDAQLQQAYDWSRVSVLQGMVNNPFLGEGLVAGYRTSGESARPGFAWYFGRDSQWTSLALNAIGDFADTKTALEFVTIFQRDDGKMPHEISQTASLVPWFKDFPYGYASADATPLYIVAANDYVTQSGDTAFAKKKWDSLWKAYQFLKSTYDAQGYPQNFGIGHGWVEGGPLLPIKTELYQSALGAEAIRALSHLAQIAGKTDVSKQLGAEFAAQQSKVDKAFWLTEKNRYAFALDKDGKPVDEASVLATVPMWFNLLDEKNSARMIAQLADSDHQTDWGMRIVSERSSRFSGGGYHYGSVWPLFTGWASVGEYRYHRAIPAYSNLRANAMLALDGSLGHVTEVLSGDSYQPLSTSSPHQIWSAAMVVSPILRGMFGLSADGATNTLTLAPHVPTNWSSFAIRNIRAGTAVVDLSYTRTVDAITLQISCKSAAACPIEFAPALSLRAEVSSADFNGRSIPFHLAPNDADQHAELKFSAPSGSRTLRVRVRNDFGVAYDASLPPLGARSNGLRVLTESWSASHDTLTMEVAGKVGASYELMVWNPSQSATVEGGELLAAQNGLAQVRVAFRPDDSAADGYTRGKIIFHFSAKPAGKTKR